MVKILIERLLNRIFFKPNKTTAMELVAEKMKARLPIKLHVGCGKNYLESWINLDNNSDYNIFRLDINHDMRDPLPFHNNTFDFIYNEHFLEHLEVEEGKAVLKDFMRVLKKGGVLRIAMPDLAVTVDKYINLPIEEDPTIKIFRLDFIKTRAERINIAFRQWGHKWLYDAEELERRLKEAGCENIVRCARRESKHRELRNLETREESNLIMEVIK
jgi:predicted SAM-dependent methyltransferase